MMPRNTSQVKIENRPHLQLQVVKGRLVWLFDGQNVFKDEVTKSLCGTEEDFKMNIFPDASPLQINFPQE